MNKFLARIPHLLDVHVLVLPRAKKKFGDSCDLVVGPNGVVCCTFENVAIESSFKGLLDCLCCFSLAKDVMIYPNGDIANERPLLIPFIIFKGDAQRAKLLQLNLAD